MKKLSVKEVEPKEPSEDGSVVGVREVQPDYTPWESLTYDQRHDFAMSHRLATMGRWQPKAEQEYARTKQVSVKEVEVRKELKDPCFNYGSGEMEWVVFDELFERLFDKTLAQAREEREESVKHQAVLLFQRSSETLMGDYRRGYEKAISDLLASAEGDK